MREAQAMKTTKEFPPTDLTKTVIETPALTEVTVSVKVTVPLQQYGNVEMFVSQKFVVADTQEARNAATIDGLNQLKGQIAQVVLPLAEAEVERGKPALLREANPDTWMQKNNSVYRWLRVAQPDMNIPAMEAILLDESRIANTTK
jgi:hypothetical protein